MAHLKDAEAPSTPAKADPRNTFSSTHLQNYLGTKKIKLADAADADVRALLNTDKVAGALATSGVYVLEGSEVSEQVGESVQVTQAAFVSKMALCVAALPADQEVSDQHQNHVAAGIACKNAGLPDVKRGKRNQQKQQAVLYLRFPPAVLEELKGAFGKIVGAPKRARPTTTSPGSPSTQTPEPKHVRQDVSTKAHVHAFAGLERAQQESNFDNFDVSVFKAALVQGRVAARGAKGDVLPIAKAVLLTLHHCQLGLDEERRKCYLVKIAEHSWLYSPYPGIFPIGGAPPVKLPGLASYKRLAVRGQPGRDVTRSETQSAGTVPDSSPPISWIDVGGVWLGVRDPDKVNHSQAHHSQAPSGDILEGKVRAWITGSPSPSDEASTTYVADGVSGSDSEGEVAEDGDVDMLMASFQSMILVDKEGQRR